MGRASLGATLFVMLGVITQLLFLGGCSPDVGDSGQKAAPYTTVVSWDDDRPGTGFGSALAADSQGVWVGAPEDVYGRIDRIQSGHRQEVLQASTPSGLGLRLSWSPGLGLAIGAPLAGDGSGRLLSEDGTTLLEGQPGEGLGSAIADGSEGWVVGGNQRISLDGLELNPPGRARALVLFEGQVVAGVAQIRDGIWTEDQVFRTADGDSLAGASLCVGDVDNDDRDELVVGSPGANEVIVLDSLPPTEDLSGHGTTYRASGYFGWSVNCRQGEFWVGAPLYGAQQSGAVFRILHSDSDGEVAAPWFTGHESGSQMGFALASGPREVWIGSPGTGDAQGRVDCAY